MSAHNANKEAYSAKETLNHYILPPASGGTIDLANTDGGVVLGNTASNENWVLPPEEDTPIGTIVYISNLLAGVLTIKDDAGSTIGTVDGSLGEIKGFILSATLAWKGLSGGGTQTFQSVTSGTFNATQYFNFTPSTSLSGIVVQGEADDADDTQATNINTAVAITRPFGTITTQTATTAALGTDSFAVTSARITAKSAFLISTSYSGTIGTAGMPIVTVTSIGAGTLTITIYNAHATNALNGTFQINFAHIQNLTS